MTAPATKVVLFSDVRRVRSRERFMPLGTLAIGSALAAARHEVVVIDGQVDSLWEDRLASELSGALFLGVSSLTGPSILPALRAVALARSVAPHLPVVWGGYHATQAYSSLLGEGVADVVVRGYGEEVAVVLARELARAGHWQGADLSAVAGIAFRRGAGVHVNAHLQVAASSMVPLDYSLIDVERYFQPGMRVLHYVSSYGCPHACTFCAEPTQSLRTFRGRTPADIVEELQRLQALYSLDLISIVDPNYSSSPRRVVEMVALLETLGAYVPIMCDMRASDVCRIGERTRLERLRAVGFERIFVGVESGSDRVLAFLRKGSQVRDAVQACRALSQAGIATHTSFLHDIPGEAVVDSEQTLALAATLATFPGNQQSHHFYTPYPETEIFASLVKNGGVESEAVRQVQWAGTSTYWGSGLWPGRPEFRRRVLRALRRLSREHPDAVSADKLPVLSPGEASGRAASLMPTDMSRPAIQDNEWRGV